MTGYVCEYAQAEALLVESLRLEETLGSPSPANLTKRLSELARLTYDEGKYGDAVGYYERAVPRLERMGVQQSDPLGYAAFLEDYVNSLKRVGRQEDATSIEARAAGIRGEQAWSAYRSAIGAG